MLRDFHPKGHTEGYIDSVKNVCVTTFFSIDRAILVIDVSG